jgi:hypothetical protein
MKLNGKRREERRREERRGATDCMRDRPDRDIRTALS